MMCVRLVLAFALVAVASAFSMQSLKRTPTTLLSPQMSTTATVLDPLPSLYVYDHCPFCVRVRFAFGIKGLKHNLVFMANDDVPTPTNLVGKKIAPIFEDQGEAMLESLDIIAKVDSENRYGSPGAFKPASDRTDIKEWQKKVKATNSLHQRSRYMMVPMPEFHMRDGREAFVKKHPVPPYDKPEWAELDQATRWRKYEGAYQDSLKLIDQTSADLVELDKMVYSADYCTEGGLSYDDIDLWARLRSLTVVKGVKWPDKLRAYMDNLAKLGDCPLYDSMAC